MRKIALIFIASLVLAPASVYALGLGAIEPKSSLNQPFDATIQLLSVRKGETEGMIVSLASPDAFLRAGVERPFLLTQLQFQVELDAKGAAVIHVTSRKPIVEPFLNFLVEVDWPRGRLLKEYTVLLDPPAFVTEMAQSQTTKAPAAAAASTPNLSAAPAPVVRESSSPVSAADSSNTQAAVVTPESDTSPIAAAESAQGTDESQAQAASNDTSPLAAEMHEEPVVSDAGQVDPAPVSSPSVAEPAPVSQVADYGPVKSNESLWAIARKVKTDSETVNQMMVALLRYNPEAFYKGNINSLRKGAILRVPDEEAVLSLGVATANEDVKAQNAIWEQLRFAAAGNQSQVASSAVDQSASESTGNGGVSVGQQAVGQLDLLAAEEGGESSQAAGTSDAKAQQLQSQLALAQEELESERLQSQELRSRVADLQGIVDNTRRMLELKENELAQLQQRLTQQANSVEQEMAPANVEAPAVSEPAMIDEPVPVVAEPEMVVEPEPEIAVEPEVFEVEEPTAVSPIDATEEPVAVEPNVSLGSLPDAADESPDLLSQALADLSHGRLLSNPILMGAMGGVLVVFLGGVYFLVKKRQQKVSAFDDVDINELPDQYPPASGVGIGTDWDDDFDEVDALPQDAGRGNDHVVRDAVPQGEVRTAAEKVESAPVASVDAGYEADDEVKDDTIAEADVYLAYGLYSQSEDLLRQALTEHPDKHEYHEKLLETYFAASNKDAFEAQAAKFSKLLGGQSNRLWNRVVAMGGELCPDNPLFSGAAGLDISLVQPVRPQTADLELGDEEMTPDLDFGMDESDAYVRTGTDFDTGDVPLLTDDMLEATRTDNFDATQLLDEYPAEVSLDDDILSDEDDGEVSVVTGEIATVSGDDRTVELGDDLEFDLTATDLDMDEFSGSITDSYPAVSSDAGLDQLDPHAPVLTSGEHPAVPTGEFPASNATAEFDMAARLQDLEKDSEMAVDYEDEPGPDFNMGGTAELPLMDEGMEDFDLDLVADDTIADSGEPSVVSQLVTAVSDEMLEAHAQGSGAKARSSAEPNLVSQLVPAISDDMLDQTMVQDPASFRGADVTGNDGDEVETMLDLAKAYLDMGDADSASSALEEIMAAGNARQQKEAKDLLRKISV